MALRSPKPIDSATAWFCVLESALLHGDNAKAERARRELERLGVKVEFTSAWRPQAA